MKPGYHSIRLIGLGIPTAAILLSYFWMAVERGAFDLSDIIVHESGRYTLAGTVFYFSHFLREIPTDLAMALFLAAGIPEGYVRRTERLSSVLLISALLLCMGAFLRTVMVDGSGSAMLDLLQFRTRDDLVEYGSHWRYHWLSTIWFGVAVTHLTSAMSGGSCPSMERNDWKRRVKLIPWLYFILLTAIFGISGKIFVDVRYAGHQAREIMTHCLITLMIGAALVLVPRASGGVDGWRVIFHPGDRIAMPRLIILAGIPLYLAAVTLSGDVMGEGQSKLGPSAMIGAHFFEHTLDYLLVLLLAVPMSGWIFAFNERKSI